MLSFCGAKGFGHLSLLDSWGCQRWRSPWGDITPHAPRYLEQAHVPAVGALGSHNVLDVWVRSRDYRAVEDRWLTLSVFLVLWPIQDPARIRRRIRLLLYVVSCLVLSDHPSVHPSIHRFTCAAEVSKQVADKVPSTTAIASTSEMFGTPKVQSPLNDSTGDFA